MQTAALANPLPAARPPRLGPDILRCPVRWTCAVCHRTVLAGASHVHLVAVLDAPSGAAGLSRLTRHPAVAGLDAVRHPDGSTRWLVWSRETLAPAAPAGPGPDASCSLRPSHGRARSTATD